MKILLASILILAGTWANATEVSVRNSSDTCDSSNEGSIRYVSSTKVFEGCDGTSWGSLSGSSSSMLGNNWPDAIICDYGTRFRTFIFSYTNSGKNEYIYKSHDGSADYSAYHSDKTFYVGNVSGSDCDSKSISQLYTDGQAFNFVAP